MKIGIISEPAHAKHHAKALSEHGFDPVILGGNPSKVPPSIDILVCRVASCSHNASAMAQAVFREGKIPVVFENGVTNMLAALEEHLPQDKPVNTAVSSVAQEVEAALLACGVFSPKLLRLQSQQAVDYLTSIRAVKGSKARVAARRALDALRKRDFYSVRRHMRQRKGFTSATSTGEIFNVSHPAYSQNNKTNTEPVFWLVSIGDETAALYAEKFDLRWEVEPTIEDEPAKVEETPAAPLTSAPETTSSPVPALTLIPDTTPVEAPVLNPETPTPTSPILPAPPSTGFDIEKDMREALSLLQDSMRTLGFQTVTLTAEGKVEFTRVIVTEGTFRL